MSLLAVLVYLHLLVLDGTLTLLQLILHTLNMLLLTVGVGDLSAEHHILLLDRSLMRLLLLLLVPELVADQGQLTLLLHSLVDLHRELLLVLLFYRFNLLPSLVFH